MTNDQLANVKSLLNTGLGTEGQLLIPRKIYQTLIVEVQKSMIPMDCAAIYVGPDGIPGSSLDVDLENVNLGKFRLTAEGASFVLDNSTYTSTNIKPLKYGVLLRITRELQEDSQFDILANQLKTFGRRAAENVNALVIAQLDTAANTVAVTGAAQPTNWVRAMQYLEDSDFVPSDILAGRQVMNNIRSTDTFVEAMKAGDNEILKTGFRGSIYGLRIWPVSTNAGMTNTTAYVIDRTQAYMIVEKRTLTVEGFDIQSHDMSACALSQRIAVKALRTSAICKITTS